MGAKLMPLFSPPSWESWSTGRAMGLRTSFHGLSARPPNTSSLLFFSLLAQTIALSPVSSLPFRCEFRSACACSSARRPLSSWCVCSSQSAGKVSMKRPITFWGRPPSFSRSPIRDSASSYTPFGGGSGLTLPHREAKMSGVGCQSPDRHEEAEFLPNSEPVFHRPPGMDDITSRMSGRVLLET